MPQLPQYLLQRMPWPLPPKSVRKPIQPDTREVNLILFGLSEQRSLLDTKGVVDEVLAGKPIQIKDMFRLGKVTRSSGTVTSARPHLILNSSQPGIVNWFCFARVIYEDLEYHVYF